MTNKQTTQSTNQQTDLRVHWKVLLLQIIKTKKNERDFIVIMVDFNTSFEFVHTFIGLAYDALLFKLSYYSENR